jgi:hypothetical protein
MGNLQTSDNHNSEKVNRLNHKGGSLLKVRPALSEHTVNFSRNDLIGTVSALNLSSIEDMKGGAKLQLRNIPQRDRFSEFETSKRKNNQNGGGLSTSNADLSLLKDMILGRQQGGSVETSKESCGCGEGLKVLNLTPNMSASYNPLLSVSENSYTQNKGYSATSSFNNNNNSAISATSQNMLSQIGGSDHSATSSFNNNNSANYSATSSFNNNNNNSATSQDMISQLGGSDQSATSSFNNNNSILSANYSATSSFNNNNNNSLNSAKYSATSSFNNNNSLNSVTSPNMLSQLGGSEYSATSNFNNSNNNSIRGGLSATSSIELFSPTSQLNTMTGGHNSFSVGSAGSATLAASATSAIPINYDMLIGGSAKKSKSKKSKKSKRSLRREEEDNDDTDDIDLEDLDEDDEDIDLDDEDEDFSIDIDETETATVKSSKSKTNSVSRSQTDKSKREHRHSSSNSSSTSTTSCSNSLSHPSSSSTYSETNTNDGALTVYRMNRAKYNEQSKKSKYLSTSSGGYSSESSNSVVNIKQFYSSDSGELYSADSNFLRNNISKNRLR